MPDRSGEVDAAVLGGRANIPNSATSTSTALDAVVAISGIKDVDTAGGGGATEAASPSSAFTAAEGVEETEGEKSRCLLTGVHLRPDLLFTSLTTEVEAVDGAGGVGFTCFTTMGAEITDLDNLVLGSTFTSSLYLVESLISCEAHFLNASLTPSIFEALSI